MGRKKGLLIQNTDITKNRSSTTDVLKEGAWQLRKAGVFLYSSHTQNGGNFTINKLLHISAFELTLISYIPRHHLSFIYILCFINTQLKITFNQNVYSLYYFFFTFLQYWESNPILVHTSTPPELYPKLLFNQSLKCWYNYLKPTKRGWQLACMRCWVKSTVPQKKCILQ
jgi:hypothetical protein